MLGTPNRVSAGDDPIDQLGDGPVRVLLGARNDGVLVRRGGIAQDPHDLVFRKKAVVVHRKQERLANGKGCHP